MTPWSAIWVYGAYAISISVQGYFLLILIFWKKSKTNVSCGNDVKKIPELKVENIATFTIDVANESIVKVKCNT